MSVPKASSDLAKQVWRDFYAAFRNGQDESDIFNILDRVECDPEAQRILGTKAQKLKKKLYSSKVYGNKDAKAKFDKFTDHMKAWQVKKIQLAEQHAKEFEGWSNMMSTILKTLTSAFTSMAQAIVALMDAITEGVRNINEVGRHGVAPLVPPHA